MALQEPLSRWIRETKLADCQTVAQRKNVRRESFPLLPTAEYDKAYFINMTRALEGSFPYMYLDTQQNVTVGIGCMLNTANEAAILPFVDRKTRKRATAQTITNQFKTLKAMHLKNTKAELQSDYTSLDLPDEAITEIMATRLKAFKHSLQSFFGPGWLSMPTEGKMGLLSMTYSSGFGTMQSSYMPILLAAANQQHQGDWKKIVDLTSNRSHFLPKASADRAQWTRELFAACIDTDRLLSDRA